MKTYKKDYGTNRGYVFKGDLIERDSLPLLDYPRPSFKRDSYLSLSGLWDLTISKDEVLPNSFDKKIMVPLPLEAFESQVNILPEPDDYIFYHKIISLDESFIKDKIIIHFDGVFQIAKVYINRNLVKTHIGAYDSFEVVLEKPIPKIFDLIVVCQNKADSSFHQRGKGSLKPNLFTYTTTSGIYKPVWIESVNSSYIESIKFTPNYDKRIIKVFVKASVDAQCLLEVENMSFTLPTNKVTSIQIGEFHLWENEDPFLYGCKVTLDKDTIETYFALRHIQIDNVKGKKVMLLNGKPLFLSGVLNQGYYGYNSLTPYSYKEIEDDILRIKSLGFNTIRVHVKTECDMFYYLCDKLGMYVIQDIPNGGSKYSFKSIGFPRAFTSLSKEKNLSYKKYSRNSVESRDEFYLDLTNIMMQLYNHPSILIYTLFNEGWGEFDPSLVYQKAKKINNNVLFDTASGWVEANESDFFSIHSYTNPLRKLKNRFDRCYILTEVGGISLKEKNIYGKTYGHQSTKSPKVLETRFKNLYLNKLIPQIKDRGLSCIIYTQYSDCETECNGIFSQSRDKIKIDEEVIKNVNENIYKSFSDAFETN